MDNEQLLQAILGELKELKQGQADIIDDVKILKMAIENDIPRSISLLSEGHKGLSDKLSRIDKMADDIEEIKGSIVAVEAITVKNSNTIVELKKAQA